MTWQMSPNGSHLQYFRYDPYTYGYIFCIQSSKQESIKKKESFLHQELFAKLTRIASLTSEMFMGRERFATILLMRLTETIILWLSDDQNFWEEIEGPRPLGPLGLQQVSFFLNSFFNLF